MAQALDILYELLRNSPPREQVQTVLLDWGAEQLYSLLLTPGFGDKVRDKVFRVRSAGGSLVVLGRARRRVQTFTRVFSPSGQILYKLVKSERVSERHKQRVKLRDFGYLGLVCFLEDIPVTVSTVQCLYGQVLATGTVGPAHTFDWCKLEESSERTDNCPSLSHHFYLLPVISFKRYKKSSRESNGCCHCSQIPAPTSETCWPWPVCPIEPSSASGWTSVARSASLLIQ